MQSVCYINFLSVICTVKEWKWQCSNSVSPAHPCCFFLQTWIINLVISDISGNQYIPLLRSCQSRWKSPASKQFESWHAVVKKSTEAHGRSSHCCWYSSAILNTVTKCDTSDNGTSTHNNFSSYYFHKTILSISKYNVDVTSMIYCPEYWDTVLHAAAHWHTDLFFC